MSFSGSTPDFRALFESLPGCCVGVARDLKVVAVSDGWLAFTKTSRPEVVGRSLLEAYEGRAEKGITEFVNILGASLSNVFHCGVPESLTAHWEGFPFEGHGARVWKSEQAPVFGAGGEVMYVVHQLREEERDSGAATESDTQKQLRELKERLEQSNEELRSLSYSVSHDLRAPLRAIDGWSQVLKEDYLNVLDEQGVEYLSVVCEECGRMAQMIDDVVRLSRVAGSLVEIRELDFSPLAENVVVHIRQKYPDREVQCEVAAGMKVNADEGLLEKLLMELVDNAWKFSDKQAEAKVSVGQIEQEGETVFFVRDNGVGFDMEYADKLFSPFQKMHRVSDYPGSGVGLALVRRVVRMHMGRIWVESSVNQGTTFFFTLKVKS